MRRSSLTFTNPWATCAVEVRIPASEPGTAELWSIILFARQLWFNSADMAAIQDAFCCLSRDHRYLAYGAGRTAVRVVTMDKLRAYAVALDDKDPVVVVDPPYCGQHVPVFRMR